MFSHKEYDNQKTFEQNKTEFISYLIKPEFQNKFYNEDSKKITKSIFCGNCFYRGFQIKTK